MKHLESIYLGRVATVCASALFGFVMCAGSQVQLTNPAQLCAAELAKLPVIQEEASKVEMPALDFTRRICDAALLAAKIGKATLPPSTASALPSPSTDAGRSPTVVDDGNAAGAAGAGG